MMNNNKDQMHPEDFRNMIIFAVLSVLIWFAYESFVGAPQAEQLKQAKAARAALIEKQPELMTPYKAMNRDVALKQAARIKFDNPEISGSISLKGGLIDDLSLKHYFKTLDKKENVVLLSPVEADHARYMDYGWVSKDKALNLPNTSTQWGIVDNDVLRPDFPVTLAWNNGQGLRFERIISVDQEYLFTITQKVINTTAQNVELFPYALVSQKDIPADHVAMWIAHEGPMGFIGDSLEQMNYTAMKKEPSTKLEADTGWIGISDKYWLTALIPTQNQMAKYRFQYTPDPVTKERNIFQTDITGAASVIPAGGVAENTYRMYAGAKKVLTLQKYQDEMGIRNFDLAVDFGWFWFLTYPLFLALHYIGLLVGNMGAAIILLTIVIRSAVFPLTNISYRSFAKMKVVGPQVAALKVQYADDKEQLQAEIVKIYQREGVNPMSGCLPILVQIPIFFSFYKILFTTIEIRHAPFMGWIQDLSAQDPTSVFNGFGLIPWDPPSALMIGAWPCMMLIVMLLQKKLNPPPQDKVQRHMMNFFPFFITLIMSGFASGLVIYWTFSAAMSVLQQVFIMRSMNVPVYFFEKDRHEELEAQTAAANAEALEKAKEAKKSSETKVEEAPIKVSKPKPKKKKKKK